MQAVQRGFKIYRRIYRTGAPICNLAVPAADFAEAQAAGIAATFQVTDGPNDEGQMFHPRQDFRRFPAAARQPVPRWAAPDMSDLPRRASSRGFPSFVLDAFTMYQEDGPDYIHAILTGIQPMRPKASRCHRVANTTSIFRGHAIGMPKPLERRARWTYDRRYANHRRSVWSSDVASFLMWAAEPKHRRSASSFRLRR